MVTDLYDDARALKDQLEVLGATQWAHRLDDILRGGSTGTEILMGLRWLTAELLQLDSLDSKARTLAEEIHSNATVLLAAV